MTVPNLNSAQKAVIILACIAFSLTLCSVRWEKQGISPARTLRIESHDLNYEFGPHTDVFCVVAPLWAGPEDHRMQLAPLVAGWLAVFIVTGVLMVVLATNKKNLNKDTFSLSFVRGVSTGIMFAILVGLVHGVVVLVRWIF